MLMRSARLLRFLRACGSLPSFITWLALATSPVCSLALRLPMPRPPAPFAPTLATHQDMASGMYGRLASESEEQVQTISYQADALHARHLSAISVRSNTWTRHAVTLPLKALMPLPSPGTAIERLHLPSLKFHA